MAMKSLGTRVPGWPEYVADLKARGVWESKELREAAAAEWDRLKKEEQARDEAPIVADLKAAGVDVGSAWDIVNRKESFPLAMPVLRKHLELNYPPKVREGIARAMSDSAARPYWSDLVALYRREADGPVKDALAIALCGAAGAEQFDELISLSLDPANGPSRVALIWALERRVPVEQAEPVLLSLAKDPATRPQAETSLKIVRAKRPRRGKQ